MQLPDDLRAALREVLRDTATKDVAAASRDLSQRYRLHHGRSSGLLLQSELDAVAYAAYRLPATFAAIAAVLNEVRDRRRDLQPKSLLDVGAGPGSAGWAAAEVWPELEQITALERDSQMIRIGKALAAHSSSKSICDAVWSPVDVGAHWECEPADVAIAAYVIGELAAEKQGELVRRLWDCTADTTIIVEPGTPRGFEIVRKAGDHLASAGAHIIAPFPHDWNCLESEADWCHFSQRVPRTRTHRAAKGATLSYEDEKYSYVVASRRQGAPIAARVIRHPQVRSGHIRLALCTARGVQHVVIARSRREAYRRAKNLVWGSAIPLEDAPLFGLSSSAG